MIRKFADMNLLIFRMFLEIKINVFFNTSPPVIFFLARVSHRFLMKTVNDTYPLCFDIDGDVIVKLLHHPDTGPYQYLFISSNWEIEKEMFDKTTSIDQSKKLHFRDYRYESS